MLFTNRISKVLGSVIFLLLLSHNVSASQGGFNCKPMNLSSSADLPSVLINRVGGMYWQGTTKNMDFYCASVNSGYLVTRTSRFVVADFHPTKDITCYMSRVQQSNTPFGTNIYIGSVKSVKTTQNGLNFLSLTDTGTQQSLHWDLHCNLPERSGQSGSGIIYFTP